MSDTTKTAADAADKAGAEVSKAASSAADEVKKTAAKVEDGAKDAAAKVESGAKQAAKRVDATADKAAADVKAAVDGKGKGDAEAKPEPKPERSMAEITAELDATRARLAGRIDELTEYVAPKNVMDRQVTKVKRVFVDEYGGIKPDRVLMAAGAVVAVVVLVGITRRRRG